MVFLVISEVIIIVRDAFEVLIACMELMCKIISGSGRVIYILLVYT